MYKNENSINKIKFFKANKEIEIKSKKFKL